MSVRRFSEGFLVVWFTFSNQTFWGHLQVVRSHLDNNHYSSLLNAGKFLTILNWHLCEFNPVGDVQIGVMEWKLFFSLCFSFLSSSFLPLITALNWSPERKMSVKNSIALHSWQICNETLGVWTEEILSWCFYGCILSFLKDSQTGVYQVFRTLLDVSADQCRIMGCRCVCERSPHCQGTNADRSVKEFVPLYNSLVWPVIKANDNRHLTVDYCKLNVAMSSSSLQTLTKLLYFRTWCFQQPVQNTFRHV